MDDISRVLEVIIDMFKVEHTQADFALCGPSEG